MTPIRSLDQLLLELREQPSCHLVVAAGHDLNAIQAAARAISEEIAIVTLLGKRERIKMLCLEAEIDPGIFTIINEEDEVRATISAIRMVRAEEADVLMKGMVPTSKYVRQILDKERGLLKRGNVLTHLSVLESPAYQEMTGKLLFMSDVAIIPRPDLETKIKILRYAIEATHSFGISMPKVALLAANEKVSPKIPATTEAAIIAKMAERGQIEGALVDGPISLDVALSREACKIKGVQSPVGGDADILILPYFEVGNTLYKALTVLGGARAAAIIMGAEAPCVLTSRSDSEETKLFSIALGCRLAQSMRKRKVHSH